MCLLIALWAHDGSLIIAANREERYDRPTRQPFLWETNPPILAGQDQIGGGAWLAVNDRGVLAAVTNRRTIDGDAPTRPSRGELPLLACRHGSAEQAHAALREHLASTRYNGFNLLVADAGQGWIFQAPSNPASDEPVSPGIHVIGNTAWDDPRDPRVERARELLGNLPGRADAILGRLAEICREHMPLDPPRSLCRHGPEGGTVSSTILRISPAGHLLDYLHAPGPPCTHPYAPMKVTFPQRV